MAKEKDKNFVSLGFWIFALFIMAIPCVNVVMMLIWAFAGENETRKNYFKAHLIWVGLFIMLGGTAIILGGALPVIIEFCRTHWPR